MPKYSLTVLVVWTHFTLDISKANLCLEKLLGSFGYSYKSLILWRLSWVSAHSVLKSAHIVQWGENGLSKGPGRNDKEHWKDLA